LPSCWASPFKKDAAHTECDDTETGGKQQEHSLAWKTRPAGNDQTAREEEKSSRTHKTQVLHVTNLSSKAFTSIMMTHRTKDKNLRSCRVPREGSRSDQRHHRGLQALRQQSTL